MFHYRFNTVTIFIFLFFSILTLTLDSSAYEKFSHPVIFIHGISGGITTWQYFAEKLEQNKEQNQLTFGGCVTFNRNTGLVTPIIVNGICDSTAIST